MGQLKWVMSWWVCQACLSRAVKRYNRERMGAVFGLTAVVGDAGTHSLAQQVPWHYDVVSCFGGLQYGFENEKTLRCWLQNISSHMRPGGVFVGR